MCPCIGREDKGRTESGEERKLESRLSNGVSKDCYRPIPTFPYMCPEESNIFFPNYFCF